MTPLQLSFRGPLVGSLTLPGDKSVSHRAVLFNLLASGRATVNGLLRSEDVEASMRAARALGAVIDEHDDGRITITGTGGTLTEPTDVIDCGNSGTTMRLLTGLIASEPLFAVLTGDASLRGRPMRRVADPLRAMGVVVDGRHQGDRAPLAIRGGGRPLGEVSLSVASAQVKTCLLLAHRAYGLRLREPARSRDHSERMLRAMGATLIEDEAGWLCLSPCPVLSALDVDVPGDLSSAAFFLVAASIVAGSDVRLRHVGVNPTRTGVIDALRAMGADLTVQPVDAAGAEPMADVRVRATTLHAARIDGELALRCLDELPVLAVAAAFAEGTTVIADAAELRVKESDRIATTVAGLRALGVAVEETPDGMIIEGGVPGVSEPRVIDAHGDHRIAMAFAVASLALPDGATAPRITGAEVISTSYPDFMNHVEALCG